MEHILRRSQPDVAINVGRTINSLAEQLIEARAMMFMYHGIIKRAVVEGRLPEELIVQSMDESVTTLWSDSQTDRETAQTGGISEYGRLRIISAAATKVDNRLKSMGEQK